MSIFDQSVETENRGMAGGTTYYDFEDIYQDFKERLIKESCIVGAATLSDLKAELAKHGLVAVPVGHLQSINSYLSDSIEQAEAARDWVSDLITKATEEN